MQLSKKMKKTWSLSTIIGQMDLTDIYRIVQIYIPTSHRMFSKIDHTGKPKSNCNKHSKIEITSYIPSEYDGIKVEINSTRTQKIHVTE